MVFLNNGQGGSSEADEARRGEEGTGGRPTTQTQATRSFLESGRLGGREEAQEWGRLLSNEKSATSAQMLTSKEKSKYVKAVWKTYLARISL